MPLTLRVCGVFLLLASGLLMSDGISGEPRKTLVEVWCGGDDGLTQKLRDSLEKTFQSSSDFQLSSGKKPGTLVVTIPTNVPWKQVRNRTRVLYNVDFASASGLRLGGSRGECWDSDLARCAAHVVADAKTAARKLH